MISSTEPARPGFWREYEGSVQDWLVQSKRARELAQQVSPVPVQNQIAVKPSTDGRTVLSKKKLSYKEQRELDGLPAQIAVLEAEQQAIADRWPTAACTPAMPRAPPNSTHAPRRSSSS